MGHKHHDSREELAEQDLALEDAVEEEEWESDWGSVFWCVLCLLIVLGGCGIAIWQPWL